MNILPSKLIPEKITVSFNFAEDVEWEVIESQRSKVIVFSGLDDHPEQLLDGPPERDGVVVYQRLQLGRPGVVYKIIVTVTLDSGAAFSRETLLAVLPSIAKAPPPFSVIYTSRPYPIEVLESLGSTGGVSDGRFITVLPEGFKATAGILGGMLKDPLVAVSILPEGFVSSCQIAAGSLRMPLVEYENSPEGFISTCDITTGSLEIVLVSYLNYAPEGFRSTAGILNGTLS